MPKGHPYTSDEKSLMFRIIKFVESEKEGPVIPMYNVNERLITMLNISHGSLFTLKQELTTLIEDQNTSTKTLRSTTTVGDELESLKPVSPKKRHHCGRPSIILSDYGNEMLRYEFHLLLSEKVYPTLRRLLIRLKKDLPDFPINSITSLSKHLKELGFVYRKTNSVKAILDSTFFVAERARYFHHLNILEEQNALIFFQDETWLNANEEKRNVWIDSNNSKGRFRSGTGKGKKNDFRNDV
jgi:hypothetical protein